MPNYITNMVISSPEVIAALIGDNGAMEFDKLIPMPPAIAVRSAESSVAGVQFETSWSPPHSVIQRLAARFPTHRIEFLWADEDIGVNCGHKIFEFGSWRDRLLEDSVDFALTVTGEDREDYMKSPVTGKWKASGR